MDNALNLQDGSPFIQLPPEIRVEIYSHLFFSTRVTWGRNIYSITDQRTVPSPNALALLRTCRQVHLEIGRTWLHQILFSFESAQEMLEKLTDIPPATRALIRHARVPGDPIMLLDEDDEEGVCYCTSQMLKILPGLALDRLTILGSWVPEDCYETLDMLVRHGAGWKELYFLAHDSTFLAYKHNRFSFPGGAEERFLREPQPAGWQRALDERDGDGASVEIYRATSSHPCSVLLQPATRTRFAQALPPGKTLKTFGKEVDASLMVPGEREKEVLVVVRRGKAVDYVQKEEDMLCLEEGHLRLLREWMTACIEARTEQMHADIGERRSLVDHYTHVDEYRWPTAWSVPPEQT